MKKKTGEYYTPLSISDFMVRYIFKKSRNKDISILEPSVGDGVFIESLARTKLDKFDSKSITVLDINKSELLKAGRKIKDFNGFDETNILHKSFLEFQNTCKEKYSLIIGNPPYINKKYLPEEVISLCGEIHRSSDLSSNRISNIWTSFVVAGIKLLDDDGKMAFVLPADVLQVKYAEEIRDLLTKSFARIEIFTLDTSAFPEIEQQTAILFAFKKSKELGTFFYQIDDIKKNKVKQISSNGLMISQYKWTHYNLSYDEIALLNRLTSSLPKISDFVDVSAGIVTGANDFFIPPRHVIDEYELDDLTLPILQKSSNVNNIINFTSKNFEKLAKSNKATNLVSIEESSILSEKALEYIKSGEDRSLNLRYKCSLRNKWYCVPNISTPSEAFFFKRSHNYPKLMKNSAKVYVTDAGYKVNTKEGCDIHSFINSFYNIITLIYAELMGRKYGGGVLELTPNEFKELPLIYTKITYPMFRKFAAFMKKSDDIVSVLENRNELDNQKSQQITKPEMLKLKKIYRKLVENRLLK